MLPQQYINIQFYFLRINLIRVKIETIIIFQSLAYSRLLLFSFELIINLELGKKI